MQLDRFTIKSQEALAGRHRARGRPPPHRGPPEHLLAALLEQPEGVVVPVLRKLGARPRRSARDVNAALDELPDDHRRRRASRAPPAS